VILKAPATVDEISSALPLATAKLQRIISREGDANGERLKNSYLVQLVAEQVTQARAEALYKGKEPAVAAANSNQG